MVLSASGAIDPYGQAAGNLLKPLQSGLAELAREVADFFYDSLSELENTAVILRRLRPTEYQSLKDKQAQHVMLLLSEDLQQADHQNEARRAGLAHAMVGVEILWLVKAYNLYQDEIYRFLLEHIADSSSRETLMRIVSQRIMLDLEGQVASYRKVSREITSAFVRFDQHVMSASNLTDVVRGALEIIGDLSGDISAFFARADDQGELQIEQSCGAAADQYHMAMEAGTVPRISVDPEITAGQGPGGRAWRSGEIIVSDAWLIESDKAPWRHLGEKLGFRSSAAVPLLDESGRAIALLSLYSRWPGFFSTDRVKGFFRHIQRLLSHALQQVMTAPVIPMREQQAYRLLLQQRQIVIYYQPIINLSDGGLEKIEALARLRADDGSIISPQRFLPALGRDELLALFRQVLVQVCADYRLLEAQGMDIKVAINFPAEGLDDLRYRETLFEILNSGEMPAHRLQLEILETQDSGETTELRMEFIQSLRDAGIEIAEDDLGSGHSSLLRLDQYAFDEVKIDQGLVRGVLHNPKRAVEFILYLTRLAHAFDIPVTVEGLENAGMIEAAAILGADRGQGYGIARPMEIEMLPDWYRHYQFPIHAGKPKTAIGAMAGYLLWDMQLAAISERPELVSDFVGAKSIVDEFISANNLQGGRIDELLRRSHALAAMRYDRMQDKIQVRAELLLALTEHWLAELD